MEDFETKVMMVMRIPSETPSEETSKRMKAAGFIKDKFVVPAYAMRNDFQPDDGYFYLMQEIQTNA